MPSTVAGMSGDPVVGACWFEPYPYPGIRAPLQQPGWSSLAPREVKLSDAQMTELVERVAQRVVELLREAKP